MSKPEAPTLKKLDDDYNRRLAMSDKTIAELMDEHEAKLQSSDPLLTDYLKALDGYWTLVGDDSVVDDSGLSLGEMVERDLAAAQAALIEHVREQCGQGENRPWYHGAVGLKIDDRIVVVSREDDENEDGSPAFKLSIIEPEDFRVQTTAPLAHG